jgi:hypothetical protein
VIATAPTTAPHKSTFREDRRPRSDRPWTRRARFDVLARHSFSFDVLYKTSGLEVAAHGSAKDHQKARPAASDYSSSLLTINRLEATLTSTQSYNSVRETTRWMFARRAPCAVARN